MPLRTPLPRFRFCSLTTRFRCQTCITHYCRVFRCLPFRMYVHASTYTFPGVCRYTFATTLPCVHHYTVWFTYTTFALFCHCAVPCRFLRHHLHAHYVTYCTVPRIAAVRCLRCPPRATYGALWLLCCCRVVLTTFVRVYHFRLRYTRVLVCISSFIVPLSLLPSHLCAFLPCVPLPLHPHLFCPTPLPYLPPPIPMSHLFLPTTFPIPHPAFFPSPSGGRAIFNLPNLSTFC